MTSKFKPMLAFDGDVDKVVFPCVAMPKIDGVRGLNFEGVTTGRSLKKFKNNCFNEQFNKDMFDGLDGEIIVGDNPVLDRLANHTQSALSTIDGDYNYKWFIFDCCHPNAKDWDFIKRLQSAEAYVKSLNDHRVTLIPYVVINNKLELEDEIRKNFEMGYEGTVVRACDSKYKWGRSTGKDGGGLWRFCNKINEEAVVIGVEELMHNDNEAKINELGYVERSSHIVNLRPSGMIGSLIVKSPKWESEFKIGAGKMTHEQRKYFMEHQDKIIGKVVTFKHHDYGSKDVPRQGTFQCFRNEEDIS